MELSILREKCDDMYSKFTPYDLEKRYCLHLNDNTNFPTEINNTDNGTIHNPCLGKLYYIRWCKGGEENKPSILLEQFLSANLRNYDEWIEKNERRYYICIYNALNQ
jgi:hypothetical protein